MLLLVSPHHASGWYRPPSPREVVVGKTPLRWERTTAPYELRVLSAAVQPAGCVASRREKGTKARIRFTL